MKKISDIFDIKTGGDLWLEKEIPGNIPVVSLGFENNGIVGYIQKNNEHHLYPAGSITVSGWAGGMKAFVQIKDFYVRGRVKILLPKREMTMQEKFYYCCCFNANAYRYTYGRKSSANRFSDVFIPSLNEIPKWVNKYNIKKLKTKNRKEELNKNITWNKYKIVDIFNIYRGKRLKEEDREPGNIRYYSASQNNNGLTDMISNPLFVEKNALIYTTFGDCFYIEGEFTASDEISIMKNPKMNKFSALFLVTIFKQNKFKYQFGRKAFFNKYKDEYIMLPSCSDGTIDWNYMEKFIKALPYADKI